VKQVIKQCYRKSPFVHLLLAPTRSSRLLRLGKGSLYTYLSVAAGEEKSLPAQPVSGDGAPLYRLLRPEGGAHIFRPNRLVAFATLPARSSRLERSEGKAGPHFTGREPTGCFAPAYFPSGASLGAKQPVAALPDIISGAVPGRKSGAPLYRPPSGPPHFRSEAAGKGGSRLRPSYTYLSVAAGEEKTLPAQSSEAAGFPSGLRSRLVGSEGEGPHFTGCFAPKGGLIFSGVKQPAA
jgi:hypothetical protein